jgi:hypothetical protein
MNYQGHVVSLGQSGTGQGGRELLLPLQRIVSLSGLTVKQDRPARWMPISVGEHHSDPLTEVFGFKANRTLDGAEGRLHAGGYAQYLRSAPGTSAIPCPGRSGIRK